MLTVLFQMITLTSHVRNLLSNRPSNTHICHTVWNWKYSFAIEVFGSVAKLTLSANSPNYATVLKLDQKIRERTVPPSLKASGLDETCGTTAYIQSGVVTLFHTLTILYLHKSFFAQALIDHPENPLLSRYAPSFLAVSSCASVIIQSTLNFTIKAPHMIMRLDFSATRVGRHSFYSG